MKRSLLAVLLLFAAASCTMRDWHQGLKAQQRNECYKMAESQQRDCFESLNYSYDDYLEEHRQGGATRR